MNLLDAVITVDEDGQAENRRVALQILINTGLAWTLQGRVGREAMDAIEDGRCALGVESRRDYWGNRIPSRFEVEPGTAGSVEFVEAHGYTVSS